MPLTRVATWFIALLRFVGLFLWAIFGLWVALAIYYTVPTPPWLTTILALGAAAIFLLAMRERFFQAGVSFRNLRWTFASLGIGVATIGWFASMTPDPNQDWAPEHSRVPIVTIEGDKVRVENVRNFTWRSRTDFTEGFYDRTYDMNRINSVYYVVVPLAEFDGVAHVFVCFGFSDGQHVAVSVEGRRVQGIPYRVLPSMFNQYQLIYAVGDERDVVGLRGGVWKQPVRFYPVNSSPERKRALFVDMMQRAHSLEKKPEYYNLITNNCMNNITDHLRTLGHQVLPRDLSLLLTGFSDRVAFDLRFIDTDLTFDQARQAFRVDEWMATTPLDDGFSARLRETIARQVADVRKANGKNANDR